MIENWLLKEVYVLLNYLCINKDSAQHCLLGTTIELVHTVQYMLFDMPHRNRIALEHRL